ncbi:uncharacterized protein [Oscarella lobularis]|uniref:uncharacterized protein isoform X2 n=1 Tax=Oscarella lobularis TaxID=121494 RepID=UPI003313125F
MGERDDAALLIQRRYREHRARKKRSGEENLGSEFAALYEKEMSVERRGGEEEEEKERATAAATIVQRHYRGMIGRRKAANLIRQREDQEAAARTLQKQFRKYKSKKEEHIKRSLASDIPKNIERPMLSQQIVDEVTRAMELLIRHAPGTLDEDQIKRTRDLEQKSLAKIPIWKPPEVGESDDDDVGATKSLSYVGMTRKRNVLKKESLWSLKRPIVMPHPLKKQTNYLRVYLKSVGKPEKSSASIRARFKNHPKVQSSKLTEMWDLKKKEKNDVSKDEHEVSITSGLSWDSQDKSWSAPYSDTNPAQFIQSDFSYYSPNYDYLHMGSAPVQKPPYQLAPSKPIRLEPLPREPWPATKQLRKKGPQLNGYSQQYKTSNNGNRY